MSEQTPRIVKPGDTFLRRGQVLERTGQSRSTLYARMAADEFPRPLKDGAVSVWLASEVQAWIEDRARTLPRAEVGRSMGARRRA